MVVRLLIFVLLPVLAFGTTTTIDGPEDLPYSSPNNNDTVLIEADVSTIGGIMSISHSGIVVLGQGYTITWNTLLADYVDGVYVTGNVSIRDLNIIHYGDTSTATVECNAVRGSGTNGITLINDTIVMYGDDARCIDTYGGGGPQSYNIYLDSVQMWNNAKGYSERGYYDGAAVRVESRPASPTGDWFSLKAYRSVVHISHHSAFVIIGGSGATNYPLAHNVEIAYCSTYVDHTNDYYPVWDGVTYHTSANAYGIHARQCDSGLSIHDNYVGAGQNFGGSRGIMLENCIGTATDSCQIYNNVVKVNCGPTVDSDLGNMWAMRVRGNDGRWSRYLHIYNNDVEIFAQAGTSYNDPYARNVAAFHVSVNGTLTPGYMLIENNTFAARSLSTSGVNAWGCRVTYVNYTVDATLNFKNNRIIGASNVVNLLGNADAPSVGANGSASGIFFDSDTLEFDTTTVSGRITFDGWYPTAECTTNVALDVTYLNGTDPTDISIPASATPQEVSIKRTMNLYVRGSNNLPVVNASVNFWNAYDDTVLTGITDSGGLVSGIVTYYYASNAGDSSAFNDFSFEGSSGGNYDTNAVTVGWTDAGGTDTLDLSVVGTGVWGSEGETPILDYIGRLIDKITLTGKVTIK